MLHFLASLGALAILFGSLAQLYLMLRADWPRIVQALRGEYSPKTVSNRIVRVRRRARPRTAPLAAPRPKRAAA